MTDLQIYRALRKQFRTIDDHADELARRCETFAEAKQLSDDWAQAQRNYLNARNRIFDTNAARVRELYAQLGVAQKEIDASLQKLKKVAGVLDRIRDAVRIATSLVGQGKV